MESLQRQQEHVNELAFLRRWRPEKAVGILTSPRTCKTDMFVVEPVLGMGT